METPSKYGLLFGGEPVSESEKARVMEEIERIGGTLSFKIERGNDGWTAVCHEVPSIIVGNTNPNPNDIEIQSEIRAGIFAAFDIQVKQPDIKSPLSDSFRYSFRP